MKIYPIPNAGTEHRRVIRTRVMLFAYRPAVRKCVCHIHMYISGRLEKYIIILKKLGSHRGMGLGGKGIQCKVHARVLVSVSIPVCCFFSGRLHGVEE